MKKQILSLIILLFSGISIYAQDTEQAQIHGNFQLDAQTYREDLNINAFPADEKMLLNSYSNIIYTKGRFSAGARFEGYLNSMQGFKPANEGVGFPYAWAKFEIDNLEVTVGSFYEQFGSGLVFRAYEEKTLGYDNAMNGIRLRYNIGNGVILKAVYGQQRLMQKIYNNRAQLELGRGIVRGLDGEFFLNELVPFMAKKETQISFGGSFVSKYEIDDDPVYKLPLNVAAGAGRMNVSRGKIDFSAEYAYKSIDPSAAGIDNSNGNVGQSFIYRNGQGALVSASYSQKGLGIYLMAKSIDNMNFRSERNAKLNDLNINSIPDITKNHTYNLASIYPYGTQVNGEAGIRTEISYKFKRKTALGGHYGTIVGFNYSRMFGLKKTQLNDSVLLVSNSGTAGYNSSLLKYGDDLFYEDIVLEVNKKINKKVKSIFILQKLKYNNSIVHGAGEVEGFIDAYVAIADVSYKFTSKKVLRTELQHLYTKQDKGSWAMLMFEYSIPHWFFVLSDQYNYGNEIESNRVHYYNAAVVYNYKANRFQIGYGKVREGVVCTGGVCRRVPASNGITVSITSSF